MQRLIIFLFILGFISPCLCARCVKTEEKENTYNVIDYGAHGDGKSDDSKVLFFCFMRFSLLSTGLYTYEVHYRHDISR